MVYDCISPYYVPFIGLQWPRDMTRWKNCPLSAKNRVLLKNIRKKMQLFHVVAPLELIAIELLGELIQTKRGNRFLLLIADKFSNLTRKTLMKSITVQSVVKVFINHWVMAYGRPCWRLSGNGRKLTAIIFQHVCQILEMENLFTKTSHRGTMGK